MSNPPKSSSTKPSSQPPSTRNSTDEAVTAALQQAVSTIEETRSLAERLLAREEAAIAREDRLLERERELADRLLAREEASIEREDRLLDRERALRDFHEAIKGTTDADVRIYWDIRVVRGEDIPFTRATGTSSFPGMLSQKMKAHAPSMIQQEVMDKIAHPLVAAFMEEAENQNAAVLRRIAARPMLTHEPAPAEGDPSPENDIMSVARRQEGNMSADIQSQEGDEDE